MVFPVVMYGCECGTIKKAEHWRIDVFELWCNPKGNQFWIFIRRTDAEAEVPILWPLDEKSWLIGKDPDAGEDWRQEEKGMTEDEMAGWHHWLSGHEFEQTVGDSEGQGSLVAAVHGVIKSWRWLRDWTAIAINITLLVIIVTKAMESKG